MAPPSRLSIAKPDIIDLFERNPQRIYTRADIDQIVYANRRFWRLTQSTTVNKFINFLIDKSPLQIEQLDFTRSVTRYTWGTVPTLSLIQSINDTGYFSHYTGMYLNGLTEQQPVSIYFNQEQKLEAGGGTLTQAGIKNAFRGKVRVTNNTATFRENKVYLLSGANTGQLGVVGIETTDKQQLRVTSIERTLIDATVRPVYSGGIHEVAKAFVRAHDRFSINRLASMLRKINYTYPYHQAIGFYLERTGLYKAEHIELLRKLPVEFDFYLDYGLKDPDYVKEWKLFIPKGF